MRLADGLGVNPVRIAGPPRVPSVTRRLGPRFGGAADGCCAKDGETHANGSPSVAAATRPFPVLRNRLRVNIPVSSFARPGADSTGLCRRKLREKLGNFTTIGL